MNAGLIFGAGLYKPFNVRGMADAAKSKVFIEGIRGAYGSLAA
jgi:hypothetical protein